MARHGLKSVTKAKARRLAEAAEEEAAEALALAAARASAHEASVVPDSLAGEGHAQREGWVWCGGWHCMRGTLHMQTREAAGLLAWRSLRGLPLYTRGTQTLAAEHSRPQEARA